MADAADSLGKSAREMWSLGGPYSRGYTHCLMLERRPAFYLLDAREDWVATFGQIAQAREHGTVANLVTEIPLRTCIILQMLSERGDDEVRIWSRASLDAVYPMARQALENCLLGAEHKTTAVRLALYVLTNEDFGSLVTRSEIAIENEPFVGFWIEKIAAVEQLQSLSLRGCSVAKELRALSGHRMLESLDLTGTDVMNPDLQALVDIPGLSQLTLLQTGVNSGADLWLRRMSGLRLVLLPRERISDADLRWMRKSMENCLLTAE